MNTRLRVTATAVLGAAVVLGAGTACQRSTEGLVAQTTEPGPPLSAEPTPGASPAFPGLPEIRIPGLPLPTRSSELPEVPAPANSTEMDCEEYNDLDEATRAAVVKEILSTGGNPLGPQGQSVGQVLADAACQFMTSAKVSDVLLGGG